VHTEVLSGGDVDNAPLGNFPGPEDVDLNGDGLRQPNLISNLFIVNLAERVLLQRVGRTRMTAAGQNANSLLLIFVRQFDNGAQGLTSLNAQRVMVADSGSNTRTNVAAHELGHALNINGDFQGVAGDDDGVPGNDNTDDDPDTDMDETRQTELMHTTSGPEPRDIEVQDGVTARTRANTYPHE